MKSIAIAALVAALPVAAASAAPSAREPSIPFVNHGGIRDWQAVDEETLYVQARNRDWYRAELIGPCLDLTFANAIGFETRGTDSFDRFSSIRVRGQRCAVKSLVKSDPPPSKAKKVRTKS
jgi:hypothetical protein